MLMLLAGKAVEEVSIAFKNSASQATTQRDGQMGHRHTLRANNMTIKYLGYLACYIHLNT